MELSTKIYTLVQYLIVTVTLLISSLQCTSSEYHEFNVTLPMILTSLRTFEKTLVQQPEPLYLSKMKNGTAILRSEEGYGLMAVVQEMNLLNRVTTDSSLPQNCVDYVQISSINGTRTTGPMCGYSVGKGNIKNNFKPAFVDKTGQIELSYLISERVRLSAFDGYITNFNLSVTPFIECPEDAFPFGNEEWTPCSRIDSFSCIPADLFCDGVINCGFPGEFGLDESNCKKRKPVIAKPDEEPEILAPPPRSSISAPLPRGLDRTEEVFNFLDSKNKPYDPYVAQNEDIWRLEDLSTINEHEGIQRGVPTVSYAQLGNGVGFLLLLCLLISLLSTSLKKCRKSNSSDQMLSYDIESLESNDTNENSKALLASTVHSDESVHFDMERDPAPPYRECVQPNSDYNYISGLFFEYERPPSYEEIKVHQSGPPSYRAA